VLNIVQLSQAADESFLRRLKPVTQEGVHDIEGECGTDDSRSHYQDIHVVMLDTLVCGVGIVAYRRADPRHFVGGDANADAGTADEDASLGRTGYERFTDDRCKIRIV
jgi:hypothetical protein